MTILLGLTLLSTLESPCRAERIKKARGVLFSEEVNISYCDKIN
jgi:hypothetical protein